MTKEDLKNSSRNKGKPHVRIFGGFVDSCSENEGGGYTQNSADVKFGSNDYSRSEAKKSKAERREQRRVERREYRDFCHSNSEGKSFGVIVLFAGIILLLNVFNIIPWGFWDSVKKFWPFLLIVWGIGIILGRNIFSRIITLFVTFAVCLLILIYGLVQVASPVVNYIPTQVTDVVRSINLK